MVECRWPTPPMRITDEMAAHNTTERGADGFFDALTEIRRWENNMRQVRDLIRYIEESHRDEETEPASFKRELADLLNKYSKENGSNTPDFVLAQYLTNCLASLDMAVQDGKRFHREKESPG